MHNRQNKESWNKLSEFYQSNTRISLENVHYGPYGPGEKELQVIGDVKGKDILELCTGGGQNAIILKKWGAKSVTGVDQSSAQLNYAKQLAKQHNVKVRFIEADVQDLTVFEDDSFDIIISSHGLNYVENLKKVIKESARVIRPSGTLVWCMGHPIAHTIWEAIEEDDLSKVYSYFTEETEEWEWANNENKPIASFKSKHYRFSQLINWLISNKFEIKRVIEPKCYSLAEIKNMNSEDIPYQNSEELDVKFVKIHQKIPFSIIYVAKRKKTEIS